MTLRLRLYVAGESPNSRRARSNLRAALERAGGLAEGRDVDLELIDLLETPDKGLADGILVTPTLVRLAPQPVRKVIGDLSDASALLQALDAQEGRS